MPQEEIFAKGLDGIVVDETHLSMVDGQKGELVYLGYDIDEMAKCTFEEVCHLFLYGKLPNQSELALFDEKLKSKRAVSKHVLNYIQDTAVKEEPMAVLRTAVSMLSLDMSDVDDLSIEKSREHAIALIAKCATLSAAIGRVKKGGKPVEPDNSLSHAANFLKMLTGERPEDVVARTLDVALVLHVDHGFNASTFVARAVTSTLSDMVSAVTAAIGSLKGPLHGGANTAVMKMLMEIGDINNVEPWLEKALEEKRKVMGFGHRVYKVLDPRAIHLKRMSKEWGERVGEVKWFKMSEKLEDLIMQKKKLNANVDFYSASTYYAMGIEPDMYTVIFALARMCGWTAHVMEQLSDNRLMRPGAKYMGVKDKKYEPIENRS